MKGIPKVKSLFHRVLCFSIPFLILLLSLTETALTADLGLIEAQILHEDLSKWVVLDARPKSEWLKGHIPGAISFSWEDYTRTDESGVPYRVWSPEEISAELGRMGIDENTPVSVYGDADKSWGGEGWACWILSWLGHKGPVRLLAGGIQAWRNNNFSSRDGIEQKTLRPVHYDFQLNPGIDISPAELQHQKSSLVLIDTRSTLEWFRGRIPGAVHIPWDDFFSGKERRPLSPDALRKLLGKHGVNTKKPIVYYCTGGIRSGYAWLVHQLSGLPAARNYEGGFEAWKKLSSK